MESNIRKECIFCRIADQDVPTQTVWEDDEIVAFADMNPLAPVHVLIIPRKHISSMNEITAEDMPLLGKINYVATCLAKRMGIAESGWRLVNNCGKDAGQEVFHVHFHLIGGENLGRFKQK